MGHTLSLKIAMIISLKIAMIVRYGPYTKSKNSHDYKIWAFTKSKTTKIWALTKSKTIVIGHLGNYVVLFLVSTLTTSLTMMNNVLHTISNQNRIVRMPG